jgi:hypothetical protein
MFLDPFQRTGIVLILLKGGMIFVTNAHPTQTD